MEIAIETLSRLLIKRINSAQLSKFLQMEGLYAYKNKNVNEKLDYLHQEINENSDLKVKYEGFLLEQIKYTTNRIVITTPVELNGNSSLSSDELFNRLNPNYRDLNNILTISDEELTVKFDENLRQYIQVYEKKTSENNQINCISKAYVKKIVQQRAITDEDGEISFLNESYLESIWIDIFPQKKYYRIYLSERLPNTQGQLSLEEVYEHFSPLIESSYRLNPIKHSAKHVFYKIYKSLTMVAESPYVARVETQTERINQFVDDISTEIGYSDESRDNISLKVRVKKLMERAIIQQDFQNYVETTINRAGFVDKFQYQDPSGGRVLASSNDETYDMSKHDIYFDTKETIDINKILNTLWVRWFKEEFDDGIRSVNQIKIKYENHDRYYITHFLYSHVTKEESNYVLPKFDEYEAT